MTFRELRQFTEIIRTLGYPQPVGIDSFDTPNFELMANLLHWLSTLYDPEIVILPELSNEHGRVEFVRGVVQQMAIRSGFRLNPKKLYASDRFAVRELLKIASPIYQGIRSTSHGGEKKTSLPSKPTNTQKITTLSSSVPKRSVALFDQLEKEIQIREMRKAILQTSPPLDEVEKGVLSAVDGAATRLETLTRELDRLNSDEDALNAKIKQRKHELERQSKRLMSVQTIRPAFMDEYEMHEQELQDLFKVYFQHYRNVDYFEKELQKQSEVQKKKKEEIEKNLERRKNKEQVDILEKVKKSFNIPQYGDNKGLLESGDELGLVGNDDSDAF